MLLRLFSYHFGIFSHNFFIDSCFRLKATEVLLNGLDELKQSLCDLEQGLVAHDTLTADMAALQNTRDQLTSLDRNAQRLHDNVSQVNVDMMALKKRVMQHRSSSIRSHPDVERLDRDVEATSARYENLRQQTKDR